MTYFGSGSGDGSAKVDLAPLRTLRGYWQALRHRGAPPRRAEIDPRGLADCLEFVFLLERIAPGQARFRLAGMHLADLMGMDVRGMPISALFDPAARASLANALEPVFAAPSICEIGLEADRSLGRRALSGKMLLLPLRGDDAEPGLALGCLVTSGVIGRAPRRFTPTRVLHEPLLETRPHLAVVTSATPQPLPENPRMQRPWLRLVSSID